jgi:hypothetical protein
MLRDRRMDGFAVARIDGWFGEAALPASVRKAAQGRTCRCTFIGH